MSYYIAEQDSLGRINHEIKGTSIDLSDITKKRSNNKIGFYSVCNEKGRHDVFVMPKNLMMFSKNKEEKINDYYIKCQTEKDAILKNNNCINDDFFKIINKYFDLRAEYKGYRNKLRKEGSYDAFIGRKEAHIKSIDGFIFNKYKYTLLQLLNFFKKFNNNQIISQDVCGQNIKYKFNIKKNITEINKANIHQIKKITINHSKMASVSYHALKLFKKQIDNKFKTKDAGDVQQKYIKELYELTKKIENVIYRKFSLEKIIVTERKLVSQNYKKFFNKTNNYKDVYKFILSLFGLYGLNDDNELNNSINGIKTEYIFFNPEFFFEWYLYDLFKKKLNTEESNPLYSIYFDRDLPGDIKDDKKYFVHYNGENVSHGTSNPDFVIVNNSNEKKIIIDAKWKVLTSLKPDNDDIYKLKADSDLRSCKNSMLIYCEFKVSNRNGVKIEVENGSTYNINKGNFNLSYSIAFDKVYEESEDLINLIKDKLTNNIVDNVSSCCKGGFII